MTPVQIDLTMRALASLRPGAQWKLSHADGSIEWLDEMQTRPDDAEIAAEAGRLATAPPVFDRKAALIRARDARKLILDALTGIAGRASRAGDDATALEADALAVALLTLTSEPAVVAATNDEEFDDAVMAFYKALAATASAAVRSAFNAIAT